MATVAHMKWWGWGVEGVAFHHEDKPALRPFVLKAVDLDLDTSPVQPLALSDLPIPESRIGAELMAELIAAAGVDWVKSDDLERVLHTYGKSLRDLLRLRGKDIPRIPDVVVYPGDEDDVRRVVDCVVAADAVLIPFGGGSNISGSLEAPAAEARPVISLDMGRLNRVLDIDEVSGLARIQAGALGPDLEAQL